jgi:hypothetical protein
MPRIILLRGNSRGEVKEAFIIIITSRVTARKGNGHAQNYHPKEKQPRKGNGGVHNYQPYRGQQGKR